MIRAIVNGMDPSGDGDIKNIGINAVSAVEGGGQTYLLSILRYASRFPEVKVCVFSQPQFCHLYDLPAVEVIPCAFPGRSLLHRVIWEKFCFSELLEKLNVNIVFCPGGQINFRVPSKCKTVVTFQNMLIFDMPNRRKYPFGYMRFRLALLAWFTRNSFRKADLIVFISEYAKEVIDKIMPSREGKSVVVPHGLEDRFRASHAKDLPRLPSLPQGDYLLYVSLIDFYKAHIEVVQAYHLLRQKRKTSEKLLLVGPEHTSYGRQVRREIQRLNLKDHVIMTGSIPYSDMPSLYHHAKVHIFASCCENCPNIVLECLASGRPLLTSNIPPMPEFAGDAAAYFDPTKPEELADLLVRVLDDEAWMQEMGRKAVQRSQAYSWEASATRIFTEMLSLDTGECVCESA